MSDSFPPDLARLLGSEKDHVSDHPGAAIETRVREAVEARIALPIPSGGGKWGTRGSILKHALAFTLGGVVVGAAMMTREARIVYVDRVVPSVASSVPLAQPIESIDAGSPLSVATSATQHVSPAVAPTLSSATPDGRGLAAERNLLDVARSALARGEAEEALVATSRHQREFPEGVLVEEREALAVKALVMAHRDDEARVRGARFLDRFPRSVSRASVQASLATLPE